MSDKDREYEEIMKLFEQKYPESTNSDRQRQPQSRYSADRPVSQRTPQQRTATAQPSRQTVNNRTYSRQHIPQKHRTAQKRRQRRLFGASAAVLAIALLVVIIIVIARSCSVGGNVLNGGSVPNGTDVLNGTWNLDGVTVYQFDGNGHGSLNLPSNTYPFTYEIKDNELRIDFESDAARDADYTFTVEKDKLILKYVEKDQEKTYELMKEGAK